MKLENYSLMGKAPNKEGSGRNGAVNRGEKIDKVIDTTGYSKEGDLNIRDGRAALRKLMKFLNIFAKRFLFIFLSLNVK